MLINVASSGNKDDLATGYVPWPRKTRQVALNQGLLTVKEKMMKKFLSAVTSFLSDEDGASAVEYGILVAAVAAIIVTVTLIVGRQVENAFNRVCHALASGGFNCTSSGL